MKLGLTVVGDGRYDYLLQAVASAREAILHPITARVMVNDEADPTYCAKLDEAFPDWDIVHTGRKGMAGAVNAAWERASYYDVDYSLHLEEDFTIDARLPISEAVYALEHDQSIAQMLFQRQPISDPEVQGGSVAAGFPDLVDKGTYGVHSHIFSLNPCLIPRRILAMGWDTNNEAGMTERLLDLTYQFGVWLDGPLVTHIGAGRSEAWRL